MAEIIFISSESTDFDSEFIVTKNEYHFGHIVIGNKFLKGLNVTYRCERFRIRIKFFSIGI